MHLVKLIQVCLLHVALLLHSGAFAENCKTPNCLIASSISSASRTKNTPPTEVSFPPVEILAAGLRLNAKDKRLLRTTTASHSSGDLNGSKSDSNLNANSNASSNGVANSNLKSDPQSQSNAGLNTKLINKRTKDSLEPKEKLDKKAVLHSAKNKKSGDNSAFKVKAKSLHQSNGVLRANQQDQLGQLTSQPSSQQNQQSNETKILNQQPVLPASLAGDDQADGLPKVIAKKDVENGQKKSRARRAPRGGRISGKGGGSSNQRRQGAAKDGETPDDDSGSMAAKPLFPLVVLSIIFLSYIWYG